MNISFQPKCNLRRLLIRCAAASIALASAPTTFAIEVGAKAPQFDLASPSNAKGLLRLSDFKGQYVYLDFWASWCGPCRASFPWMNSLQERFASKGLRVIGISVDVKQSDAKKFLSEVPARFDIAFDETGATPRSYGVKGMPTSLLIGPDGTVLFTHQSFKDSDKADLEAKIRNALETK